MPPGSAWLGAVWAEAVGWRQSQHCVCLFSLWLPQEREVVPRSDFKLIKYASASRTWILH